MNKVLKFIIAIFGATNYIFNIAMPIFVSLILINLVSGLSMFNQIILLGAGMMASLYRAMQIWFKDEE